MKNNHTQDFYIEVVRARSADSNLTLVQVLDRIQQGLFEYKAFGISKEVANAVAEKAFRLGDVAKFGEPVSGYDTEGGFISLIEQPGIIDTPKTVTFGAGGLTAGGNVSLSATGEFQVLTSGYYAFKQRFRAGRDGAVGESEIFFWAENSIDGGSTWNVLGNSLDIALDSSKDTTIFFDLSLVYLPAGVMLRNRFARSGDGDDLVVGTPSATLQSLNVPQAPSAQVTIYKV